MTATAQETVEQDPPRPIPECYWVVPGRLLVGEYPGSASRASAMDRLRRFTDAGVTCFIDLTELAELPGYEPLLPMQTQDGRRIEYLREPIPDHGVPANPEDMHQAVATLDGALQAGHVVYLHCRAGIGRSALVAGCWLAGQLGPQGDPIAILRERWRQCAKSAAWPVVPETDEQEAYVRRWQAQAQQPSRPQAAASSAEERVRGALLGLAAGDDAGQAREAGRAPNGLWTQHTALTLCLAESLLECGGPDPRDQIERYLRCHRDGHLSPDGRPMAVTPDVAKALANYQWRQKALAGPHDPRDRSTASLPRVLAAVAFARTDAPSAVRLAGECSRTTHQSPFVIDACRYFGALLVGALRGAASDAFGAGLYEPEPGLWVERPLKPAVAAAFRSRSVEISQAVPDPPRADAIQAVMRARDAVISGRGFDETVRAAAAHAAEPALEAALTGALYGAVHGERAVTGEAVSRLARRELIESFASRLSQSGSVARGWEPKG